MKNKLKWYLRFGIFCFATPFLLWNCESENADSPEGQQSNIETVAVNEVIDFFSVKMAADPAKPGGETYVTPHLDHIAQEEISNSDALLTIIPATTVHSAHYSRILLLKINNKIQSIVFSMYASGASTNEHFSGEIIITDINGNFLNGYRVVNGIFVSQFRKTATSDKSSAIAKSTGAVCPDHGECVEGSNCIVCLQELEEVVVTGNLGNNGGPTPFVDLNDFPGIDEGGAGGPDMGMDWDYGPGEGGSNTWPQNIIILDELPGDEINNVTDYMKCFNLNNNATFTLYVDQPTANSDDSWSGSPFDPDVGHTFVSIEQNGVIRVLGFYPDGGINPFTNPSTNSVLIDNSGHGFDVSITKNISNTQLNQIYNTIINYNATYNLNTYNCTDFGVDLASLAGLNIPSSYGTWLGGGGDNPGKLGQNIRGLNIQNTSKNTLGGNSSSNSGQCN